jgi:hypothetical protein
MIGELAMTIFAGIVNAAAPHLDCDNIYWLVVVAATGVRIDIDSANFWRVLGHVGIGIQPIVSSSS